jgi:hypothetical protein
VLDRCPRRLLLDQPQDVAEVFWWYQNYRRGLLPVDGGLLDQPALLMECFSVIDSAIATYEAEQAEEMRKQTSK